MTIEEFEREVMTALLAGDDPLLDSLRAQYAAATVREREMTGTGFITRFEVPTTTAAVPRKLMHLDDLQVQLEGTTTPADTSLHVYNGRLKSLEVFVYDDQWPESPKIAGAWYYGTEKFPGITPALLEARDLDILEEDE
ncbi:MAG TPA: hypothetical protein VF618_23855 [Thermoanaerobaculia bacterium]